jgi:platelet-activating factor acetylhydrolase IB subunit beta/gamma
MTLARAAAAFVLASLGLCAAASAAECTGPRPGLMTTTPTSRPQAFPAVRQAIDAQARAGDYDAILIGDSIAMRWPRADLDRELSPRLLDAGIGGDGTNDVLYRLANTPWAKPPSYVIFIVGTNNSKLPPCDVAQGVWADVELARRLFPSARMYVVGVLPRGENLRERADAIRELDDVLARQAAERRYRFVDVFDKFVSACGGKTPCPSYGSDNLHPTAEGYKILGEALRAGMAP